MTKKIVMIIFLFLNIFIFSDEIEILDDDKLLNISTISYSDEEELLQKVNDLYSLLMIKGYVTSRIIYEDGKLKILSGKISKVEFNDNSTKNIQFKKSLNGIKLENTVFNIKKIDEIISKYNELSSNNLKVSIVPSSEAMYSNLIFNNDYNFKINTKFQITFSDKFQYNLAFDFNQILGLNDNLQINMNLFNKEKMYSLNYTLPILNNKFNISYTYNQKKYDSFIKQFKIEEKTNEISYSIISKLNSQNILKTNFNLFLDQQKLGDFTELKDNIHYELGINHKYFKNIKNNNLIIDSNLLFSTVTSKLLQHNDFYLTTNLNFKLQGIYYDFETEIAKVIKLNEGDTINKRYLISKSINTFDSFPLNFSSDYFFGINNKIKYPIINGKTVFLPYFDFAIIKSSDKIKIGSDVGITVVHNKLSFMAKMGIDSEKNKSINLKMIIEK